MKNLAICIIAYNEEKNISRLINLIFKENIPNSELFIYTDAPTDNTAKIVENLTKKLPNIQHISGRERKGKNHGFNTLLAYIREFPLAMFLDADIYPQEDSLKKLWLCLEGDKNLNATTANFRPFTKDLIPIQKILAELYLKARLHARKYRKGKYISPRAYCVRTPVLKKIPKRSYSDDFFLNLNIPYRTIGCCEEAIIYFRRPVGILDLAKYYFRLGESMKSIKIIAPELWLEQKKRTTLFNFAFFDQALYRFGEFFSELSFLEMVVFVYFKLITGVSMYLGFLTYSSKKERKLWEAIKTTKAKY